MKNELKKYLKIIIVFLLLSINFFAYSENATFSNKKYNLNVYYNKISLPGDAVFIRMILETKDKYLTSSIIPSVGSVKIFNGNHESFDLNAKPSKDLGHSDFYHISNNESFKNTKLKRESLLTGIPLSTYFKTGNYTLVVKYSAFGDLEEEFVLPLVINEKEFISETIPLDSKNTSIRTNSSDERWKQIKKLNGILETKNYDSIFDLNQFSSPTTATRRTSFFGDRRIFAYSNGTSATSLHYGVDFGVPRGTEVRACGGGKVVMAETRITTGWTVVIEHLPGLYSLYYHNNELKCNVGDIVKTGDLIAYSGSTGLATGPHIHWEMRLNMEAVSPDFFLGDFTFEKYLENHQNL